MTSSSNANNTNPTPITGPILVTAALIRDEAGGRRFLIAKRKATASNEAGKWEFPGGKVEPGEKPETCLEREIFEELGCRIEVGELFGVASHVYLLSDRRIHVILLCYECLHVSGEPQALDAAEVRWISAEELDEFKWALADVPLVEKLKRTLVESRANTGPSKKG